MRGHLAVLIAAALMVVGLTACGGDDASDGGAEASGSTAAAQGGACDDGDPVKAGALFSMTGPAGSIGEINQQGAEMAVADINEAGGILGRCVEEVLKDDGSDVTKAGQAARQLVNEEEVDFMVGPFLSSQTVVALDVTTPAKLIHIVQSALAASGDASTYPYAFRTEVNTDQQAESFVPFIQGHGWSKIGLLVANNEYGSTLTKALEEALPGSGVSIVARQSTEEGAPDVTPQMTALKEAGADVVVLLVVTDPSQTAAIKARNRLAWDVPMLGASSMHNAATMDNFSKAEAKDVFSGAEFAMLTHAQGEKLPEAQPTQEFIAAYKEKLGVEELDTSVSQPAGAYDSFMLAAHAINEAGTLDADAVKEYLETHPYEGVRARYEYTTERHDGVTQEGVTTAIADSLNGNGVVQIAPAE